MAIITVTVDTEEKTCSASLNGATLPVQIRGVSIDVGSDEYPYIDMDIRFQPEEVVEGVNYTARFTTYAEENKIPSCLKLTPTVDKESINASVQQWMNNRRG